MNIKDLLLPREKYEEALKKYGEKPFTFEIEKDGQVMFYFGANHSNDPKNIQYKKLKEFGNKFLEVTKDKERIVLIEGNLRKVWESEELAIQSGAEGSFITFWAHKFGIPVACVDITKEEYLEDKSEEEKNISLLHSFIAWADQFRKHSDKSRDFEKLLVGWCDWQKKNRNVWNGIEITPEKIKNLYEKVIGEKFDKTKNINHLINPNIDGPITKFTRAFSDAREIRVVSEIERYWNEGKSIFIAFGSGHLVIQKPALEALLK